MRADQLLSELPRLRGAPLSIIFTLLITGRVMQPEDLAFTTGYSTKTVRSGCKVLTKLGITRFHGERYGYALSDGIKQLSFSDLRLNKPVDNPVNNAGVLSNVELSSTPNVEKFSTLGASNVENFSTFERPTSHARDTTTRDLPSQTNHQPPKHKSSSSTLRGKIFQLSQQQPEVFELLLEAGIAPDHHKMLACLKLHLDPDEARRHVYQFLYEQEKDGHIHTAGLLITRLESGFPPPPLRCRDHLNVVVEHTPCDACQLKNVIRR